MVMTGGWFIIVLCFIAFIVLFYGFIIVYYYCLLLLFYPHMNYILNHYELVGLTIWLINLNHAGLHPQNVG